MCQFYLFQSIRRVLWLVKLKQAKDRENIRSRLNFPSLKRTLVTPRTCLMGNGRDIKRDFKKYLLVRSKWSLIELEVRIAMDKEYTTHLAHAKELIDRDGFCRCCPCESCFVPENSLSTIRNSIDCSPFVALRIAKEYIEQHGDCKCVSIW